MKKSLIIYIISIFLSIMFIVIGNRVASKELKLFSGNETITPEKAKVKAIIKTETEDYNIEGVDVKQGKKIYFSAKVLTGDKKGQTKECVQIVDPFYAIQPVEVKKGDKVLLHINEDLGINASYILADYIRMSPIIVLGAIFLILLYIFAKIKGINTIVALSFTCLSIFLVFIPSVLSGYNIYFWSILTCLYIVISTLVIVNGINEKSLAVIIGCVGGIVVSGIITIIMTNILKITGMISEDSIYISMFNSKINLKGIVFAGIIIGAVGAIIDVAMSIASSLLEIKQKSNNKNIKELYESGLTIGKDIMSTMTNTLVLAYVGSSLSVTLLLICYNTSVTEILNKELIIVEFLQGLVGSIGILLTIPFTSLVSAILYSRREK